MTIRGSFNFLRWKILGLNLTTLRQVEQWASFYQITRIILPTNYIEDFSWQQMHLLWLGSYHFHYALFLMRKVGKLCHSEYRWAFVNMDRDNKYCIYPTFPWAKLNLFNVFHLKSETTTYAWKMPGHSPYFVHNYTETITEGQNGTL